jgi:hypothetical protein
MPWLRPHLFPSCRPGCPVDQQALSVRSSQLLSMENQWCMWSDGSGPLKRKWLFLSPQEGWDCHTHIASFLPLNSVAMSLLRALDAIPQSLSSGLGADSARFTQSSEAHFFPVIKQSLSCSPWLRLKCENHCENMLQVRKRLPYVMWGTCGVP